MSKLSVNIAVDSARWKNAFPRMKIKIEKAAVTAFKKKKSGTREVTILLSTDDAIRKLNRTWRGKDKATNVLAFPAGGKYLGDIILAAQTIRRECREQDKTLENHTIHLVVHGILHLLGHDHMKPKDAKAMEKLECDILRGLGYPDPYAT